MSKEFVGADNEVQTPSDVKRPQCDQMRPPASRPEIRPTRRERVSGFLHASARREPPRRARRTFKVDMLRTLRRESLLATISAEVGSVNVPQNLIDRLLIAANAAP